jgi:membrane protease YdiL (CAAX protease family)
MEANVKSRQRVGLIAILVGLPLLSNVASFVIFAPLFAPNRDATGADFQRAGALVGIAVLGIEFVALLLIAAFLRRERAPLKSVIGFRSNRLRTHLVTGLIALLPTLLAGWLYVRGQAQAGIESDLARLSPGEVILWYVVTPIAATVMEEIIWRGYAIPRLCGTWRSLLLPSVSFALFHGIFSPLVLVAAFVQGMIWGWAYRRTESTVPGMVLHFLSRYLALVPGFGQSIGVCGW